MAAGNQQANKDKEMAKHLRESGYPHGRRYTVGSCPCCYSIGRFGENHYLNCGSGLVGSAKFRRRRK